MTSLAETIESAVEPTRRQFPLPPLCHRPDHRHRFLVNRIGDDIMEELVEMYLEFAPEDRAQGIPPGREPAIRRWLDGMLSGINLAARAAEQDGSPNSVRGHVLLVRAEDEVWELGIFVLRAVQGLGLGTSLLTALLGLCQQKDIRKIWLTVERWNKPAINLYRKVGFQTLNSQQMELEMALVLDDPEDSG